MKAVACTIGIGMLGTEKRARCSSALVSRVAAQFNILVMRERARDKARASERLRPSLLRLDQLTRSQPARAMELIVAVKGTGPI
jgi:hypothetical protein